MLDHGSMENQTGSNSTGTVPGRFAPIDYAKITVLGLGITALWTSLNMIVLPLRLLDFVPETLKNSYLGYMTFAGLVLAMITQPIIGALSDRSRFRLGRRRPFILIGIILALVFLPGIGLVGSYAFVFATFCLMQISTNTAQGPYQGFIPDLVPEDKRGRASGIKNLMEFIGGVTMIRLAGSFMDRYSTMHESSWLWLILGALGAVLLVAMLVTVITVK